MPSLPEKRQPGARGTSVDACLAREEMGSRWQGEHALPVHLTHFQTSLACKVADAFDHLPQGEENHQPKHNAHRQSEYEQNVVHPQ